MMLQRRKTIVLHVAASVAVVLTLVAVIFTVWYPQPYFRISGAAGVLATLVGVDVVLGPLLTVFLYKPGKRGLWIDMTFIAVVQVSALIYGGSVLYQQRPQYVVFAIDRYMVLPEPDLVHDGGPIDACRDQARRPCLAVATLPDDAALRNRVLERALEQGIEIEQQPRLWRPLDDARATVLARARPLSSLSALSPEGERGVRRVLEDDARDASTLRWVPAMNRRLEAFSLIIDADTAVPLDVVDVDPWEPSNDR